MNSDRMEMLIDDLQRVIHSLELAQDLILVGDTPAVMALLNQAEIISRVYQDALAEEYPAARNLLDSGNVEIFEAHKDVSLGEETELTHTFIEDALAHIGECVEFLDGVW